MTQKLTAQQERAVILVAEDDLSDEQIAGKLGISRSTITRLRRQPAFIARVAEAREAYAARILSSGIARRERRMQILDDLADRNLQVIHERAARGVDHFGKPVAGGSTGLIVQQATPTKTGVMYEYANDVGTSKELRETLKQAAQEAGQWLEKSELTGKNGGPLIDLDKVLRVEYVVHDED